MEADVWYRWRSNDRQAMPATECLHRSQPKARRPAAGRRALGSILIRVGQLVAGSAAVPADVRGLRSGS